MRARLAGSRAAGPGSVLGEQHLSKHKCLKEKERKRKNNSSIVLVSRGKFLWTKRFNLPCQYRAPSSENFESNQISREKSHRVKTPVV